VWKGYSFSLFPPAKGQSTIQTNTKETLAGNNATPKNNWHHWWTLPNLWWKQLFSKFLTWLHYTLEVTSMLFLVSHRLHTTWLISFPHFSYNGKQNPPHKDPAFSVHEILLNYRYRSQHTKVWAKENFTRWCRSVGRKRNGEGNYSGNLKG